MSFFLVAGFENQPRRKSERRCRLSSHTTLIKLPWGNEQFSKAIHCRSNNYLEQQARSKAMRRGNMLGKEGENRGEKARLILQTQFLMASDFFRRVALPSLDAHDASHIAKISTASNSNPPPSAAY
jgi:hypothetical protein